MEFSREYNMDKVRKDITFPIRPVHVVDQLVRPTLLTPGADLPSAVRSNPRLLLLPKLKAATHHANDGVACQCFEHNTLERCHREAALPDTCLKGKQLTLENMRVSPPEIQLQENPSHFYVRSDGEEDSYLAVPTPFPVGGMWPALKYEPVIANRCSGSQVAQYKALYSTRRFREVASTYQRCPREWIPLKGNPVICEASTSDEVGLVSERLYGLETIPRVGFTAHPASEPVIMVYPAMDRITRRVPVFRQDARHPSLLDAMIGDVFRPFWEKGYGCILCPVCLFEEKTDGKPFPSLQSRASFTRHWERLHYSSFVVSSTFSATQLHVRVYMGQMLYTLALANRKNGEETPLKMATDPKAMEHYKLTEMDDTLAKLFPMGDSCEEVMEVASATFNEEGLMVETLSQLGADPKAAVISARGQETFAESFDSMIKDLTSFVGEKEPCPMDSCEKADVCDAAILEATVGLPANFEAAAQELVNVENACLETVSMEAVPAVQRGFCASMEEIEAVMEGCSKSDIGFVTVKGRSNKNQKRK